MDVVATAEMKNRLRLMTELACKEEEEEDVSSSSVVTAYKGGVGGTTVMDDLNGMKPFAIRPTSVRMTTTAQTRCITFIVVREKSSFCTGRSIVPMI